jgi:aminopeptidase N
MQQKRRRSTTGQSRGVLFLRALVFLLGIATLANCAPTGSEHSPQELGDFNDDPRLQRGVSWQLSEHRKQTLSALEYDFSLVIPNERALPITGEATLRFRLALNNDEDFPVVIDFVDAASRLDSITVNGEPSEWSLVEDHVLIPAALLQEGDNSVTLIFEAGDAALNRSTDFLYTLFVPDRAHFSLPLIDQPNLKGSVAWTISAPHNWQVVANGSELSVDTAPGNGSNQLQNQSVRTFARTEPLPTYLFAFAAGKFQRETRTIDDREMTMYHRETDRGKVDANADEIFALHAQALDWLEDYTKIEYPFEKFDFVLIPAFQYGGMEHPGSILYREASLMLDATATQTQILARASVIAHETAHMWFGDLVTMNWFDDVWTKEVFANFMAAKIVNPAFPEVDHELRFHTAHHPSAYAVDRTLGANAIGQPLENLRYAGTLYGAIIYQKAPIVMRHLENLIGQDSLREGLREYLREYAYGNATWPQLIALLDGKTALDLDAWNKTWVYEAGRPRIIVSREKGDAQFVLRQEDSAGLGRTWPQKLRLQLVTDAGATIREIELGADAIAIPLPREDADTASLLPNASGIEYGDFVLDDISQRGLLRSIGSIEPAVARGAAWTTLWEEVQESRLSAEEFFIAALRELPSEQNELIVNRVLSTLDETYWLRLDPQARLGVSQQLESVLWREVESSHRSLSARAAFYRSYRALVTTDLGVARLIRLWEGEEVVAGLPLSEADRIALVSGLALRGVEGSERRLDEQEGDIENADRLARFRFIRPSLSQSREAREALFMSFTDVENRAVEPWVLEAMDNLHSPLRGGSPQLIRPALDLLQEIQETGDIFFPGRWLDATIGGYQSEEAAREVRNFFIDNPDLSIRLRNKVLQSADLLLRLNPQN